MNLNQPNGGLQFLGKEKASQSSKEKFCQHHSVQIKHTKLKRGTATDYHNVAMKSANLEPFVPNKNEICRDI